MFNKNNSCFIIAEMSANHGKNLNIAKQTVIAAKECGADAIKLQTFTADTITIDSNLDDFIIKGDTLWDGRTLYDIYKEGSLPWEWHKELYDLASKIGLVCFSSPFDFSAVDFLESLETPIYKIASPEITDIPLIEYVAKKSKPIIISTGMATYEDIELAVDTCRSVGNNKITILKCTSSYPTPIEEANLLMMQQYKKDFKVNVGISDHTLGLTVPLAAVAMGAKVIEKHFIVDKKIGGLDSSFSLDTNEFKKMVTEVRLLEKSMGKLDYKLTKKQLLSRQFSRSLYVSSDIKKGELITKDNIKSIRPGLGLHPKYYNEVLGMSAVKNLKKGTRLSFKLLK